MSCVIRHLNRNKYDRKIDDRKMGALHFSVINLSVNSELDRGILAAICMNGTFLTVFGMVAFLSQVNFNWANRAIAYFTHSLRWPWSARGGSSGIMKVMKGHPMPGPNEFP